MKVDFSLTDHERHILQHALGLDRARGRRW